MKRPSTLHEIKKVNIWTGAVSTHLAKSYSHFPYTYNGSKTLLSLGYTTHDQCFTKISGESLECGARTLTSLLECGEPIHLPRASIDLPNHTIQRLPVELLGGH